MAMTTMYNTRDPAPRALVTVNCVLAAQWFEDDIMNAPSADTTQFRLYPPISSTTGHRVGRGEAVFTYADEPLNAQQQPYVRSTLNGICFVRPQYLNGQRFDSNRPAQIEIAKYHFWRKLRVVGISIDDVEFHGDIGRASEGDPVAIKSGQTAMTNTGSEPIKAGDLIAMTLPDLFRTQYDHEQNDPMMMNLPNEVKYLPDRKVLATTPVSKAKVVLNVFDLNNLANLITPIIAFMQTPQTTSSGSTKPKGTLEEQLEHFKVFIENMVGEAMSEDNEKAFGTMEESVKSGLSELNVKTRDEEYETLQAAQMILLRMITARSKAVRKSMEQIKKPYLEEMQFTYGSVVGVATTDAEVGFRFDVMALPSVNFI